ncbi:YgaP-like transmembrane domain [Aquincola sp. MAHUQ-54]|uniref:YgaP-like transmembrane domain n=1 Tax=Aquincola agrisoli TaxID=3119538 RepID=A0AAW9QCJ0_9BURK
MLFVKNLPAWERVLRLVAGAAGVWACLHWLPGLLGAIAAACAAGTAVSGLVGYCPMRALACRATGAKAR